MPKLILYCQGEITMHAYHFIQQSFTELLQSLRNEHTNKKSVRMPFKEIKCNGNIGSKNEHQQFWHITRRINKIWQLWYCALKNAKLFSGLSPWEWKDCGVKWKTETKIGITEAKSYWSSCDREETKVEFNIIY